MNIPLISITINNRPYQVRANASVLQACEEASIDVPRFCYHEKLSVAGNCRMCLVEIQKSPKPVVSCAMPVSKGMVLYTDTPLVKKAREAVLEFLLINHPLDCPICDQGGECDLQDETLQYASDRGRFFEFKRSVEDKECGPIIKTIMTRCIHCTRCIRFSSEITGLETMGSFGRGQETEIGTYVQSFIKTELSGNLVDLCPVGALTSKPYAFIARSWELQKTDTVDFFDGICSDISVHTRKLSVPFFEKGKAKISSKEEIIRVLPKTDGLYSDNWISDKTRYAYDGLKTQRVLSPVKIDRKGGSRQISWLDLLIDISERLEPNVYQVFEESSTQALTPFKIGAVVGSLVDVESIYVLNQFLKLYGSSNIQYGNNKLKLNVDAPFFFGLNRSVSSFEKLSSLILIGTNVRFEASLLNTLLRKQQNMKALPYITFSSFSSLRLKQNHLGNSTRSLISFVENRQKLATNFYNILNPSIIIGAESLKGKTSFMLQNITRFLGKKFFAKTKTGERLSVLHSNVSSLAFSYLGIDAGVRSSFHVDSVKDKKIETLFSIQNNVLSNQKWLSTNKYTTLIAFSTNKTGEISYDRLIPIKSLYEKEGFLFNIEGRLRRLQKVVTPSNNARSLESFLIALCRIQHNWQNVLQSFWNIEEELPITNILEKEMPTFHINFLQKFEAQDKAPITPFTPTVLNFYLNDIISNNSVTMGECALFLQKDSNFTKEF